MRVHRRIFSALIMIFVLLLSTSLPVSAKSNSLQENSTTAFTGIEFVSNIETIGVAVSGAGLPPTAELSYRQSGEPVWHAGHKLMRIEDGRLLGSLFNLSPATTYDVRVFNGASEINGSVSTQPDGLSFTASLILHVDDNALPGGNGSTAAPFQSIQEAVNQAGPGTQVLVADGIYREAVTIPNSGTEGNWIQVRAAGNAAILDGADRLDPQIPGAAGEHARAPTWEATDWRTIVALYNALARRAPSPVVELNRAIAVAQLEGPAAGLAILDRIGDDPRLARSHLLPATRGDLLRHLGRRDEARTAFQQAHELAPTGAERRFLADRLAEVEVAGHDAVGGALVLDLDHDALVGPVAEVEPDALVVGILRIQARRSNVAEPDEITDASVLRAIAEEEPSGEQVKESRPSPRK